MLLPATAPEPPELIQMTLPDGGPRFDRFPNNPAWATFEKGTRAFGANDLQNAQQAFETFLREHPEHDLAGAARAFLAEIILLMPAERSRQGEAITAYRLLIRDLPGSSNAKRAGWRMGDLYRSLGWYQEAQIAYQGAFGHVEVDSYDANRSLLGIGFALLGMNKWIDAEKTFELIRKQTTDPQLLLHASMAAGHALFRQGRLREADLLYGTTYQRWGAAFRKHPFAMTRYANTSYHLNRMQLARQLSLQYVNLYPSGPEAHDALLQIAESYHDAKLPHEARRFYAAVIARYPESEAGTVARIRLIQLSGETLGGGHIPEMPHTQVDALMLDLPVALTDPASPVTVLLDIAKQYADSAIGSEALFRLGELLQREDHKEDAVNAYEKVVARTGRIEGDPWPETTGVRLVTLLQTSLQTAVQEKNDFAAVTIFHRHGPQADRFYTGSALLLPIADAHHRLGFAVEAARLYQAILRGPQSGAFFEPALMGLGKCYLDQQDPHAAQRVFERYRLQFPLGQYSTDAFLLLLTALSQQGEAVSVVRVGRQWLINHPKDTASKLVLAKVGIALAGLKRPEETFRALDTSHTLGGLRQSDELTTYADLLSKRQRHEEAVSIYRKAQSSKPSRDLAAWIQVQIARNLRESRKPDQARVVLEGVSMDDSPLFRRVATVLESDLRPL
ncbi:MAG: tetratricopeptide repeat protein, partial [Nitrospiraceae bacterium]